jgi:hypothetical protein
MIGISSLSLLSKALLIVSRTLEIERGIYIKNIAPFFFDVNAF